LITDTVPNCYCDCIDTSKIIENKTDFYKKFEQIVLKANLSDLKQLGKKQQHEYFSNLYNTAFIKEKRQNEIGEWVNYPPNPLCELLQRFLYARLKNDREKRLSQQLTDTLGLNKEIANLKYRIWIKPTFLQRWFQHHYRSV